MDNIDKLTKFLVLEEYYYDNIGGNLDIIKQTINELKLNRLIIDTNSNHTLFENNFNEILKYLELNNYPLTA